MHAVLIGINDYDHVPELRGCVNDVREMEAFLQQVGQSSVTALTNGDATAERIRNTVEELAGRSQDADTVLVVFSGHVSFDAGDNGQHLLVLPADFEWSNELTYLRLTEIVAKVQAVKCRRRVVIVG